jgi:hypothetical protein
VHHVGQPGDLILRETEGGLRQVWETDSDTELRDQWAMVTQQYERFRGSGASPDGNKNLLP